MSLKFTNPEDLKQKYYYLAGKMSGLPQFNVPKFFEVAMKLRNQGMKILNPAELDSEECRSAALRSLEGRKEDLPKSETWGQIMGRDITAVIDEVDGVVVFSNWLDSPGARLEVYAAYLLHKPVLVIVESRDGEIITRPLTDEEIEDGVLH